LTVRVSLCCVCVLSVFVFHHLEPRPVRGLFYPRADDGGWITSFWRAKGPDWPNSG
jgi:hypothetical protein